MNSKYRNPFTNPDHPLDVRDGRVIYARDVPDVVKPTEPRTKPVPPNHARKPSRVIVPSGSVLYNNLDWEHPAYRKAGETEKALLTYDKSLKRLQAAGFERHARPTEVFGLLCDGLEGKLTGQHKAIYDDMHVSCGEWLSASVHVIHQKKDDIWGVRDSTKQMLRVYIDPEGLVWDGNKYVQQNFKFSEHCDFDITGIPLSQWVNLDKFPDSIVQYLYGRSFSALPQEMREGDKNARVYLPLVDQICPVGRGGFYGRFNLIHGDSRASRGVHSAKKISTGNRGR